VRAQGRPGGALVYFVVWDIFAFILGWTLTSPFLLNEVNYGEITSIRSALSDWRFRTGLYFVKVLIGLLSFPFLAFAIPIMQVWLTHVKPTGYDRGGNCVPRLSAAQIKAKYRHQYVQRKKKLEEDAEAAAEEAKDCEASGTVFWDRIMHVNPYYDDEFLEDEEEKKKAGRNVSIVEEARRVRQKQLRRERLPEATLLPLGHSDDRGRYGDKLMVQGDPSMLML